MAVMGCPHKEPWGKYLDEKAIAEFYKEILSTFDEALRNVNSSTLEEVLNDWMATAEVMSNPKLSEALLQKGDSSKYVEITG